jgi:conjugative transposon TraN protein
MNKKHIVALVVVVISLLSNKVNSQTNSITNIVTSIESKPIFITTNKTTSLIFPFAIRSVDRGSQDVLARQIDGVDNILQLKAGKEDLQETNLTVITADGNLYSFLLNYKTNPADLVFRFSDDSTRSTNNRNEQRMVRFKSRTSTDAEIVSTSNKLLKYKKRFLLGVHDRISGINLKLRGVYIKNDVLYFQLQCINHSKINYDVDMLRFYVRDQFRSKRTAVQEVEIKPYAISGNHSNFKAEGSEVFVVALPKFFIPFAKYFTIAINEKNGARNLHLNLNNRLIIGVKRLEE